MAKELDRGGHFRATIDSYGLEKSKTSNAHAVVIKCTVLEQYDFDSDAWVDWRSFEPHEVWGRIWIIGKDGKVNATAAEALVKNAGWDGDILSIQNQTWQPFQCSVSVEESTWEGKTSFKVGFVNGFDETPSGKLGNVDEVSAKQLATQFGASFRAIAGSVKQNAAAVPNGKPAAPPKKPAAKPAKEPAPASVGVAPEDDDAPFWELS